ncbi:MAG: hypothetical protein RRY18_00410, partial [Clostridia bacterium]
DMRLTVCLIKGAMCLPMTEFYTFNPDKRHYKMTQERWAKLTKNNAKSIGIMRYVDIVGIRLI